MNVFDLFAKISLDTKEYTDGLNSASSETSSFGSNLTSTLETAAVAGVAALGALAVSAAKVTGDTAKYGDEIEKNSQKVGLSYESYQKWDYAMQIAGTSMNDCTTGLKTLTNKFDDALKGSDSANEAFERLGLSVEDMSDWSREDVFDAVVRSLQNVEDETDKAAIANDLFGKSGQNLMPMFNSTNEDLDALMQTAEEYGFIMSDDMVEASADYQDSLLTMKKTMTGVRNSIAGKFIPVLTDAFERIGTAINDFMSDEENAEMITDLMSKAVEVLTGVIDGAIKAFVFIASHISSFVAWLKSGSTSAEIFKTVIVALAGAVTGLFVFLEVVKIIGLVKTAITGLQAAMTFLAANPIVLVIAAIAALITALVYLYNNNEEFRQKVDEIWQAISGFVQTAAEKIKEIWDWLVELFGEVVAKVQEIWAEIKQTVEEAKEKVKEIIDNIVEFFTNLWESIKSVIDWIVEAFTTGWAVIQYVWSVVVDFFVGIWEGIKNVFVGVGLWFYEKFKTAWNNIKFVWNVVVDFFLDIWDGIKNVFIGVAQWFQEKFKTAWEKIKDVWSVVVQFFLDIWDGIKNVFIGAKKWFGDKFTAAWNAITDVWNGVVQFFTDIWEDIKGVFEEVKKWFEGKFGEAWEAIKSPFAAVEEFFGGVWGKISDAFDVSDADSWGEDMMNNFRNGVERARSWVVDSVSSVAATIKSFLGFSEPDVGPLSNFHTFAPDMMRLFAEGIRDNEYLVTDQIAKSFDFGDMIGGEYEISGGVAKTQDSGVVINVYATERQDEYEIAQEVQRVFVQWENQRKAAYA